MNRLLIQGINPDDAPELRRIHRLLVPDDHRVERELAWMRQNGAVYVKPDTLPGLSDLDPKDRPKLLFALCARREFPVPVAIVGSRRPDWYGELMAGFLGRAVAQAGGSVVSGGALGIDALSHQGCLNGGGGTIVVFGGGLARPHPASNRELFEQVRRSGCMISELPPMVSAKAYSFAQRNRLIAALSLAVIVVQATKNSGSLITARRALGMGRPVFAIPGDVNFDNSRGTNSLLYEGAMPLVGPEILSERLGLYLQNWPKASRRPIHGRPAMVAPKTHAPGLEGTESEVYAQLQKGAKTVDELVFNTGLPAYQVLSVLSSLELKGVIQRLGGSRFVAAEDSELFA